MRFGRSFCSISTASGSSLSRRRSTSSSWTRGWSLVLFRIYSWRGRDGNDPSVDIAKDADQRF